jgi:WD40 repeat protein
MATPRIFISYSSKDRVQAETIHKSLEAVGDVWRDRTRLETDWSREIAFALAKSDLLCLLWSADAATSKWVKHEWLTARALEKQIIPCLFPKAPDLPEPLRNVNGVAFATMEAGCSALNKRISEAKEFRARYDYTMLPRNSYIPFNPNPHFKGRQSDLLELYLKMIGNLNKIGINQVGTIGMGGIGKTQLAVEFAHRFSYSFHAVYWIQAANPDIWLREFTSITTARLRREIEDFDKLEGDSAYIFALQEYFKDHPNTLVIMDNITEPKLLNSDAYLFGLTPVTLGCDLLFTTRQHFQVPGVSSQAVNVLSPEAAYELLAAYRVPGTPEDEDHARAICRTVGFLPLAIILVGAYLNKYASDISFADYHEELVKKRLDVIDIGEVSDEDLATRHKAAVRATLEDQWRMLKDENARQLFRLAGQFPEAAIIPKARLGLLAGIAPGRSKIDQPLAKAFNHLHDLCLVEHLEDDTRAVRLHPLVHEFSNQLVSGAEQAAFRAIAAQTLREALFDYNRLEAEIRSQGVGAVIDALDTGIDWWGHELTAHMHEALAEVRPLELIREALELSANALTQDLQRHLMAELWGRLHASRLAQIQHFLTCAKELSKTCWLRTLSQSLTPVDGRGGRVLEGHSESVFDVQITSDGRKAVSASGDGTICVWDIRTGAAELRLQALGVCTCAVTPDDSKIIAGCGDGTLIAWNLQNGREMFRVRAHPKYITAVAATFDSTRAVSASHDGAIKVWDLNSGDVVLTFEKHNAGVTHLLLNPDGKTAVSACLDRVFLVWKLETGAVLSRFAGHAGFPVEVCVSPDGGKVLSADVDQQTKAWLTRTGEKIFDLSQPISFEDDMDFSMNALAITPDGAKALGGSNSGDLMIWDFVTGEELGRKKHPDPVNALAVTPDSKKVVVAAANQITVWNLETQTEAARFEGHSGTIRALAISADGQTVISGSEDKTVIVWRLSEPARSKANTSAAGARRQGHAKSVTGVVVSHSLGRVITASRDESVKIWDSNTGTEVLTVEEMHLRPIIGLGISPDGKKAFTTIEFKSMEGYVWDVETGKLITQFSFEGMNVFSSLDAFVVAPAGDRILTVLSDWDHVRTDLIAVWESGKADQLFTLKGHKKKIRSVSCSADGTLAVSGSEDKQLIVWDIIEGKRLHTLRGHTAAVTGAAISTAMPIAASTSDDGTMRVWDLQSGREMSARSCPAGAMTRVVISSDSNTVVCATAAGTLAVWNLETSDGPDWLAGHSAPVNSLVISADGKTVLSASQDKTLKVWDLPGRRMISSFRGDSSITCCAFVRPGVFACGEEAGAVHFLKLEGAAHTEVRFNRGKPI